MFAAPGVSPSLSKHLLHVPQASASRGRTSLGGKFWCGSYGSPGCNKLFPGIAAYPRLTPALRCVVRTGNFRSNYLWGNLRPCVLCRERPRWCVGDDWWLQYLWRCDLCDLHLPHHVKSDQSKSRYLLCARSLWKYIYSALLVSWQKREGSHF